MKTASDKFKDKPLSPTETFAFWIEYVIRHRGSPHMSMVGQDLSVYEYLCLDVIAIVLIIAAVFVIAILFVTTSITRLLCLHRRKYKIE